LYCQLHRSKSFDADQVIRALRNALSTTEPVGGMAQHHITELIKAVQDNESVSKEDLTGIEWGYLRLLQRDDDVEPSVANVETCNRSRILLRSNPADLQVAE
jgi:hypothetical protein